MHFAYGFGYLLGLCYFIFRWGDKEIKDSSLQRKKFKQYKGGVYDNVEFNSDDKMFILLMGYEKNLKDEDDWTNFPR